MDQTLQFYDNVSKICNARDIKKRKGQKQRNQRRKNNKKNEQKRSIRKIWENKYQIVD